MPGWCICISIIYRLSNIYSHSLICVFKSELKEVLATLKSMRSDKSYKCLRVYLQLLKIKFVKLISIYNISYFQNVFFLVYHSIFHQWSKNNENSYFFLLFFLFIICLLLRILMNKNRVTMTVKIVRCMF